MLDTCLPQDSASAVPAACLQHFSQNRTHSLLFITFFFLTSPFWETLPKLWPPYLKTLLSTHFEIPFPASLFSSSALTPCNMLSLSLHHRFFFVPILYYNGSSASEEICVFTAVFTHLSSVLRSKPRTWLAFGQVILHSQTPFSALLCSPQCLGGRRLWMIPS